MSGQTRPRHVHLVGIGGMHMSAIAQLLLVDGVRVSGSDLADTALTRRLRDLGATVYQGHAAEQIGDADLVVYTAAARPDNPEVAEARARGVETIIRAAMVARILEGRIGVAVAGTHGKTTTASLLTLLLVEAGLAPTYLLGGESLDLGGNAAAGVGPHVVVEADEYAGAFLEYRPRLAIVTNVEADHLDYYGTSERVVDAFRQFLQRVQPEGVIIACADSPLLAELLDEPLPAPVQTYSGKTMRADWYIGDNWPANGGSVFEIWHRSEFYGRFELSRPGDHFIFNATAAIAAGAWLGLSAQQMAATLPRFQGAKRRFELVGEAAGVTVVDDYAHHPTEVRATLQAARLRYLHNRLVLLFQPHTYSRTAYLLDEFATCFAGADMLYVLETFAARETAEAGVGAQALVERIERPAARYLADHEEAVATLRDVLQPGDVLLTMGAGDVNQVGPRLLAALEGRMGDGA